MSQLSEAESTEALMKSSNSGKPQHQPTAPTDLGQDLGPHSSQWTKECDRRKLSPQSDGTVPGNEGSPYVARVSAILTPYHTTIESGSDSGIILKYTPDMETFRSELQNLMTLGKKDTELWLCHQLLMDRGRSPIMSGRLVSENSLYNLLCNGAFSSVYVFQLALPIDLQLKELHEATVRLSNSKESRIVDDDEKADLCCPCGDVHFFLFVVTVNVAWNHLLKATTQVLSRASSEANLTPDEFASELLRNCPSLKLLQKSGVPCGRSLCIAETCMPECLDINTGPPDEHQDVVNQIFSESPIQPSEELCNLELSPKNQRYRLSNDMALRQSASIGITIGSYKNKTKDRSGASHDNRLIYSISKRFGCDDRDIHQFFPDGFVAAEDIDKFIESVVIKRRTAKVHRLFLFIAGHGSQAGLLTSDEETIQLGKLLEPVLSLAKHVTLIYQPCRGPMEHSKSCSPDAISLCGVSLFSTYTAGSCLPVEMVNCSAMFACMPQFASYHSEVGSLMLFALNVVVHRPELDGKSIFLRELAQMTQRYLRKSFLNWITQVQYTDRGDCGIQIFENAQGGVQRFAQILPI